LYCASYNYAKDKLLKEKFESEVWGELWDYQY
jgi:hypothetical protein